MHCDEAQPLLSAFADHEADPACADLLERHVDACPQCRQQLDRLTALKAALGPALRFPAPPELKQWAADNLHTRGPSIAGRWPNSQRPTILKSLRMPAWAALFIVAITIAFAAGHRSQSASASRVHEVVDIHLRSLLAAHLVDVASTDRHTVKPWFAGKLDFAPPVDDLSAHGFPLQGGRLEVLAGRQAASLIYTHGRHTINVLVCPTAADASPDAPLVPYEDRGFNVLHWSHHGMAYWAVSDVAAPDLVTLATLLRTANVTTNPVEPAR